MSIRKYFMKYRYVFILFLMLFYTFSAFSQVPKLVIGYVYNKEEFEKNNKKNVPIDPNEVTIFIFNTVAEAEEVYEKFKNNEYIDDFLQVNTVVPDFEGYYEAMVPDDGALVIRYGLGTPVLEPVNRRSKIITYVEGGITLEGVSIIGNYVEVTSTPPVPEQYGNIIFIRNANIVLPANIGKSNARMLVEPYVYNHTTGDTVHYRRPRLYVGKEFEKTQERLMGFDNNRDVLYKYTSKEVFDDNKNKYLWNDTVILPNAKDNFQVLGNVYIQDYLGIYETLNLTLSSRYTRKPLKFLEYSMKSYELDPKDYVEKAKKKLIEGVQNVSLVFKIGKAELETEDTLNRYEIEKLKNTLLELVNKPESKLKELHVTSVSSPDGSYEMNKSLSLKRLKYAEQLIKNMIPADKMRTVYSYTKDPARVATWEEFVEVLGEELRITPDGTPLKDSLNMSINEIRKILDKYPNNHNMQSSRISKLPLYKNFIVKYLPRLRTMKCEYKAEEFRELTPEEILKKYDSDKDYQTGRKYMELYEYWNLVNIIKDNKELENIYKLAYDYSVKVNPQHKPWVLAANNLAALLMKRDSFDINILEPLINRTMASCNIKRRNGNSYDYINLEEVVANQLISYVKNDDFANASVMAKILPKTDKYKEIIAFAYCLGGYYKITGNLSPDEKQRRFEYFNTVRNSSPLNNAVMCLAMNSQNFDSEALEILSEMPQDDPKVLYLKAVAYNRRGDAGFSDAMIALKSCFAIDEKYIDIARTDGDIAEDLFETAYEMYKLDLEMKQMNSDK